VDDGDGDAERSSLPDRDEMDEYDEEMEEEEYVRGEMV